MKIVFYASDKPRELMLAEALAKGVRASGDELEIRRTADYGEDESGDLKWAGPTPDSDVACMFGVKGKSKQILKDHRERNIATLFFDKGYTRDKGEGGHTEYSRISINDAHPLGYMLQQRRKADRWNKLDLKLKSFKDSTGSGHVLYCGSSQKYHEFHGLPEATEYAQRVFKTLRKSTVRHIIYRPKPSWHDAVHIPGTSFSSGVNTIADALRGCHCLVTHGSSAAMDATLLGIPTITLGPSIARPVSDTELDTVEKLTTPNEDLRLAWAYAMAYCQWTTDELRSGEAWQYIKDEILRQKGLS